MERTYPIKRRPQKWTKPSEFERLHWYECVHSQSESFTVGCVYLCAKNAVGDAYLIDNDGVLVLTENLSSFRIPSTAHFIETVVT